MTLAPSAPLGTVADIIRGITFKPDDLVSPAEHTVACFRTSNVQEDIDLSDVWYLPRSFARRPKLLLHEGDILISTANSWNLVGKCAWVPRLAFDSVPGGFIAAVRANEQRVTSRYLFHWLRHPHTQTLLRSCANKTTNISNLSLERCLSLTLPLPPLNEQRRIAAILDQADDLRRNRRLAIEKLNALPQAIFQEMFGDLKGTASAELVPLGNACDVRDGTHDSPAYVDQGYPLVTSKHLTSGFVDLSHVRLICKVDFDAINRRSRVDKVDILMPMIGTIGSPVIVNFEPNFAIKNVALIKFKPQSPTPSFVLQVLKSGYFRDLVESKNRGGTQKFLSLGDIRSLRIPIPPIADQDRFAQRITAVNNAIGRHMQHLSRCDELFASLQHHAFAGMLGPSTAAATLASVQRDSPAIALAV